MGSDPCFEKSGWWSSRFVSIAAAPRQLETFDSSVEAVRTTASDRTPRDQTVVHQTEHQGGKLSCCKQKAFVHTGNGNAAADRRRMSTIRNARTPNATETLDASVVVCLVFFFAVFPDLTLAISPCLDDESEHLPMPRSNHLLVFRRQSPCICTVQHRRRDDSVKQAQSAAE